jgi:hypothetical protein
MPINFFFFTQNKNASRNEAQRRKVFPFILAAFTPSKDIKAKQPSSQVCNYFQSRKANLFFFCWVFVGLCADGKLAIRNDTPPKKNTKGERELDSLCTYTANFSRTRSSFDRQIKYILSKTTRTQQSFGGRRRFFFQWARGDPFKIQKVQPDTPTKRIKVLVVKSKSR